MDPITLSVLIISTGLSIFSGVKKNQAARESGQQAIADKAKQNLVALYENEYSEIQRQMAIEVETARLAAQNAKRQQQFQQLQVAGLVALAGAAVLLLIQNLKKQ